MVSKELKTNMLINLRDTLKDLSTADEQKTYKKKVPFVNIPIELIEQWADHARMLSEVDWYKEMFNEDEKDEMIKFDDVVTKFYNQYQNEMPDVEEILDNEDWKEL